MLYLRWRIFFCLLTMHVFKGHSNILLYFIIFFLVLPNSIHVNSNLNIVMYVVQNLWNTCGLAESRLALPSHLNLKFVPSVKLSNTLQTMISFCQFVRIGVKVSRVCRAELLPELRNWYVSSMQRVCIPSSRKKGCFLGLILLLSNFGS